MPKILGGAADVQLVHLGCNKLLKNTLLVVKIGCLVYPAWFVVGPSEGRVGIRRRGRDSQWHPLRLVPATVMWHLSSSCCLGGLGSWRGCRSCRVLVERGSGEVTASCQWPFVRCGCCSLVVTSLEIIWIRSRGWTASGGKCRHCTSASFYARIKIKHFQWKEITFPSRDSCCFRTNRQIGIEK